MKVTSIKHYSEPGFPTRSILDERPELLRLVPKRWQKNPVVIAALAGIAALASGAQGATSQDSHTTVMPGIEIKAEDYPAWTLGDVAAPIVILPEEEARRIICDEAKKAGLDFRPDVLTVTVPTPDFLKKQAESREGKQEKPGGTFSLVMDGTDKKHKVSYEYVSDADSSKWQHLRPGQVTLDTDPGLVTTPAQDLNAVFGKAKPAGHYRAFAACGENGVGAIRNDLRAQVRDFIKWLKAQGVI